MLVFARFGLMADLALLMGLPLFWWAMGMAGSRVVLVALALGGMVLSTLAGALTAFVISIAPNISPERIK